MVIAVPAAARNRHCRLKCLCRIIVDNFTAMMSAVGSAIEARIHFNCGGLNGK